ncbi:MAG: cytochrome P450 [Dehalococcoidia bacterium]
MATQTTIDDETYDPFEAFDNALGADLIRDAYPKFAELRRQSPMYEGGIWNAFGFVDAMSMAYHDVPLFTALSYDAVTQVLRSPGVPFSSQAYANTMGVVMGHSILEMDEPEHGQYRELLEQAFSRRAMERWEIEVISPTIDRFIDRFAARGHADLVREFTFPFPVNVITGLLGLPEEDLPQFHRWAIELINVAGDPGRGLQASVKLRDYLIEVIDERRLEHHDDMISVLAHAELNGQRLDNEEITAFLRLLLPAGAETTYRSSGNLLFGLLTHPEQLEAVRNDRSLIPQAIEEGLRWETPLTSIIRQTSADVDVAGVHVPAGSAVMVCTGSANHDESRWEDPEAFNIFRKRFPPVAFGFGPHVCLGQHLARMETATALNALLDRLPNLRLDPDGDDPHITGLMFRSPTALPVLFDPA